MEGIIGLFAVGGFYVLKYAGIIALIVFFFAVISTKEFWIVAGIVALLCVAAFIYMVLKSVLPAFELESVLVVVGSFIAVFAYLALGGYVAKRWNNRKLCKLDHIMSEAELDEFLASYLRNVTKGDDLIMFGESYRRGS